MAKTCKNCNAEVADDTIFCPKCGKQEFNTNTGNNFEPNLGQFGNNNVSNNGVGFDNQETEHAIVSEEEANNQANNQMNNQVNVNSQNNGEQQVNIVNNQTLQPQNPQLRPLPTVVNNGGMNMGGMQNSMMPNNMIPNDMMPNNTVKHKKKKKMIDQKTIWTIFGIIGTIFLVIAITLYILLALASTDDIDSYNPASVFTEKNSMVVGNDVNGYMKVPNDWHDVSNPQEESIVFTDDVVSFNWQVVSSYADSGATNPEEWAASTYNALVEAGTLETGVNRERVNNFETFKVVCYKPDIQKYFAAWIFNTSDGKTHFVSVEGPDRVNDFYNMIYTFKEKK